VETRDENCADKSMAPRGLAYPEEGCEPERPGGAPTNPVEMMELLMAGFSNENPLLRNIEPQHIGQILDLETKRESHEYEIANKTLDLQSSENKSNRQYAFAAFVFSILLLVAIMFLFSDKPDVLIPILTGLGGLGGGFLGGWGWGNKSE
jgi:hypothetical protein